MPLPLPDAFAQVVISGPGGPDVLVPATRSMLRPGPGQLLIRVAAAGVNRHDCNQRRAGQHHDGNPVPGLEVSGIVAGRGPGVDGWPEGTPVMALVQGGGYAEFALADAVLAMPVPKGLILEDAAGLPEALFTAWWNFFWMLDLTPGEFALIHGGTSGVGHLALQALSRLGYQVMATCGTKDKVAAATGFGAAAAFDYHDADLARKVTEATGGKGISALLDMSAGAHLDADLAMMATGGRIAHLSPGGGKVLPVPLRALMQKRVAITGSLLRPLPLEIKAQIADRLRAEVLPMVADGLRPAIAAVFPLEQAAAAHREMERASHIGKILLRP
ncbi:MAG: alcohol dehydrogenase [Rhodobacteraceae bacterium]|nr:alcohol dehydrogenase [Paracoccaceae bacterium]MAY47420.1 alcohol dehydrogenase [Paracoccaceae bacterium]